MKHRDRLRLITTAPWFWLAGCAGTPARAPPLPVSVAVAPPPARTPGPATPPLPASAAPPPSPGAPFDRPPPPPREFRAAWVATVANIDWPSRPGLPAATQRAEALALLDRAAVIGLNALVLQVRPAGDAIYPSALEPWCEFLTGTQGRAPVPAYDPLAFWIAEAHRRGLELHAWFNPYRARHSAARSPLALPHLGVREPAAVKRYGDQLWMDPGEPAAAAQTLAVVADVLRRYDVDGVHIDDYFYPYPVVEGGVDTPFPDDAAWARYRLGGGPLGRDDWRRANVDGLVEALHRTVREIRPAARLGISPFGIGRPDRRPPGITGFSQYDRLYADVERWLAMGWLDYLAPQLYWPIDRPAQAFAPLLDYWLAANTAERHVWPGLYTSQVGKVWPAREVVDQLAVMRARRGVETSGRSSGINSGSGSSNRPGSDTGSAGHIHFSMVALQQDRDGLATLLQMGAYATPALVPTTPWLPAPAGLPAPRLRRLGAQVRIDAAAAGACWAVWRRIGGQWQFAVQPPAADVVDVSGADLLAVAAVGRGGGLGALSIFDPADGPDAAAASSAATRAVAAGPTLRRRAADGGTQAAGG